jgi:hypothetical protein
MLLAPQRLKPHFLGLVFGTTEVVPFPVVSFLPEPVYVRVDLVRVEPGQGRT